MRFTVNIPPFTDPRTLVDMGVEAEAAGWDGVYFWDHLRLDVSMGLDVHDPWAMLSAIAVRTERVRLGTMITPVARRRPWVLAKQLVTLDHLSGGRAVLGVGLGDPPDADFADFGDPSDGRQRAARLDEGLAVLDGLLRGERVTHSGDHFTVDASIKPQAVQRPRPPIFVAGRKPYRKPLERALRWDGFFPILEPELLSPDGLAEYLDGVERPEGWEVLAVLAPGHDPEEFARAGATELVEGAWPVGDWVNDLRKRIAAGPPR
jgi:alkanesulfonate monooxygenase SsuD/methylene tetrahydromethanopterin reductase-like flavin-dependent oxidoreductase (luciferase family)